MVSLPHRALLSRHPATRSDAVRAVEARVAWIEPATLALSYSIEGELSRLRIPPPVPPRRAQRLWERTCFEAFIAVDDSGSYDEFNFAPSGEWAVYRFSSYRKAAPPTVAGPAPKITARSLVDGVALDALIVVETAPRRGPWRLALAAVIEENDGALGYWALGHPPGDPDFHHPDAFILEIESSFTMNSRKP